WTGPDGTELLLVDGAGSDEELAAPCGEGTLRLAAAHLPAPARALFALAVRDFVPPPRREASVSERLVGTSPAMRAAVERLHRLGPTPMPVLLLGETGTGKELAARELHLRSPRRGGPFVPVNCAGLTETLIHSELFGHARGAFTGADRDRMGFFETARGGTLFLDEIGDLPLGVQGSLLRVLQESEVRRLGESLPRKIDVRLVAATHRDLAAMVRAGSFREDLYFRLKVARVELPPLRERGDDVLLLAETLLARAAGPGPPVRLSREARARLLAHRWPGNVRELENVLRFAAALAESGTIQPADLDLGEPGAPEAPHGPGEYHRRLEALRRRLVEEAMRAAGGRQAAAARWLGVSRQTLSYLLQRYRPGAPP
ncbi:MAG: sigma-54 dependent transcriptional regulator, partial [Thermoanaerobaculia bacterium]|nr:sigma-54 dependent transcriptional regulator [Thermoanaerobaculia bacterium]